MPMLKISPPHFLSEWLSPEEQKWNTILLDLYGDLDNETWTIDINMLFKTVIVENDTKKQKRNLYIGCTEAQLYIRAGQGKIVDYTKETELPAEYSQEFTKVQKSSIEISPEIEQKTTESAAKFFSIGSAAGNQIKHTISFKSNERTLTPLLTKNSITWDITLPRKESLVRDFLFGNYFFTAKIEWNKLSAKSGVIGFEPLRILFFDEEKKPVREKNSLLMEFRLNREAKKLESSFQKVQNRNGLSFKFEIV